MLRIAISFLATVTLAAGAEWPEWRGPTHQGHAPEVSGLPEKWSETENIVWKTPIPGRGHSTPLMDGNEIWLTTAFEKAADPADAAERLKENTGGQPLNLLAEARLAAVQIDRETGKLVREITLLTVQKPQWVHKLNSYASPTPVLEDGKLYCHFGTFGTACLDTKTGQVLWTNQEISVMHENGPGSSPVIWRDKLIFHMDGSDQQWVVALEKATGKLAWKTARTGAMNTNPQLRKAYGTPLLLEVKGRTELISPAADWLYSYDPATGKELWKLAYGHLGFSNVSRPVVVKDMIVVPTCFMRSKLLGIRYDGTQPPVIAWEVDKSMPNQPSPIAVGDEVYTIDDRGIATCVDAQTGHIHWRERLEGNYSASPIAADGKLFFNSQEGKTLVLQPGKTLNVLAENHLGSPLMASPIAVGKALYLRTDQALYRIEKR